MKEIKELGCGLKSADKEQSHNHNEVRKTKNRISGTQRITKKRKREAGKENISWSKKSRRSAKSSGIPKLLQKRHDVVGKSRKQKCSDFNRDVNSFRCQGVPSAKQRRTKHRGERGGGNYPSNNRRCSGREKSLGLILPISKGGERKQGAQDRTREEKGCGEGKQRLRKKGVQCKVKNESGSPKSIVLPADTTLP